MCGSGEGIGEEMGMLWRKETVQSTACMRAEWLLSILGYVWSVITQLSTRSEDNHVPCPLVNGKLSFQTLVLGGRTCFDFWIMPSYVMLPQGRGQYRFLIPGCWLGETQVEVAGVDSSPKGGGVWRDGTTLAGKTNLKSLWPKDWALVT